jgi:hypothetical protein
VLRDELDRLLEDVTLLTIGFAIALGWSLYSLAHGVAICIDELTVHYPPNDATSGFPSGGNANGGLSWDVGRHVITLDPILVGLLQLTFVLAVAVYVRSRMRD